MTTPADQPIICHPIEYLPRLNTLTEYFAFQHLAGQSQALAGWCGGAVVFDGDRVAVQVGETLAYLGDHVLSDGERFWVASAEHPTDNFVRSYWPKGVDPGWEWRCYRNWEEQPQ